MHKNMMKLLKINFLAKLLPFKAKESMILPPPFYNYLIYNILNIIHPSLGLSRGASPYLFFHIRASRTHARTQPHAVCARPTQIVDS